LAVDGPKRILAVWSDDLTNAYITGGGVAAVAAAAGAYFLRRGIRLSQKKTSPN